MSSIPYLVGWESFTGMLDEEAKQLSEEGRDPLWIEALLSKPRSQQFDADLWAELQTAPQRKDFPFREPNDLEGIRNERGHGMRSQPVGHSDEVLRDRMLGAWLGRCCGCALGKPVELYMNSSNGLSSKERIKTYLQAITPNEYPLNNYFPLHSPAEERTGAIWCPSSCRENLAFMESDDDIRYTVLGQRILLKNGAHFTTHDVMKTWMEVLPYMQVCTAETQAYRNYILRYHVRTSVEAEADWNWVATHQNPYRE